MRYGALVALLLIYLIAATVCAREGNVATTMLNCFFAYLVLQLMKTDGGKE